MMLRLKESVAELKARPPVVAKEELDENLAFLEWLGDNHFTFLGARDYTFDPAGEGALNPDDASGLGVLSDAEARVIRRGPERAALTPQVRAFLIQPSPLIITKANERSLVHRRVHMDYVGIKTFDKDGKLAGERRFVGPLHPPAPTAAGPATSRCCAARSPMSWSAPACRPQP